MTITAVIDKHRAFQPDSAKVDAVVAIVESRPFLRECIRHSVQSGLSSTVVTCSALSKLGDPPHHGSVDLVVLSLLDASSEACANALKDLSEFASGRPVIVLTSTNDVDLARAALRCGAKGFIPVTTGFQIAIEAMRFVLAGGTNIPPDSLLAPAPNPVNLATPPTLSRLNILTGRELSVVRAIQQGKPNKVIAYHLNMCESTVKVHVRNIMRKLGAKNRTDVAMVAMKA
jgi:DNA-binding NarL/FixJ family response regulator